MKVYRSDDEIALKYAGEFASKSVYSSSRSPVSWIYSLLLGVSYVDHHGLIAVPGLSSLSPFLIMYSVNL